MLVPADRYYQYALLAGAFVLLLCASIASAALRPATDADKAAIEAAGITYTRGMSWDPDNKYAGDEVAAATQFLLERNGTGTRGTWCYNGNQALRITKLNPQFRVGLAKALAEIEKQYGGKNIIQSGFRCDGTGGNHPRGCAVDIIYASCKAKGGDGWRCSSDRFDAPEQKWIDANGKNAPYNIHLRLRYAPEGHHVEPVNTQGCVTGATVGSAPSGASPSSGLANTVRNFFGQPTQPTAPPPPPAPPLNGQNTTPYPTGTCAAQNYCTDNNVYYRDGSCIDQLREKCQYGCVGVTCSVSSDQAKKILSDAFSTGTAKELSDLITKKATTSALEKIEEIAGYTPPTEKSPSTPLVLTIGAEDSKRVEQVPNPQSETSGKSSQTNNAPNIGAQQTFISPDLKDNFSTSAPKQTSLQKTLSTMKETLLHVLAYLRPFGRPGKPLPSATVEDEEWY